MPDTDPQREISSADVTVVVVSWQQRDLLRDCLRSLVGQTLPHRVLVVDNASTDGTGDMVRTQFPRAQLLTLTRNAGFAGGMSAALQQVNSRYVALLNNDAQADPHWLEASLVQLVAKDVAAVTAKLLLPSVSGAPARINNTGVLLLRTGYGADRGLGDLDDERYEQPADVFGFSGGAAVLRTLAVRAVGGFDPEYFLYYEDTDLSWRLRLAGWRISYCPTAVVHHLHAASSDPESELFAFHTERNRLLTLYRNAPVGFALSCTARFIITTGSLALKHWLRRPVAPAQVFLPQLRIRVLVALVRRLPKTVAKRIRTQARVPRRIVLDQWRGAGQGQV
ncbi:MAG: glycosyltransferase family 2 protein [Antricoccus sp.]